MPRVRRTISHVFIFAFSHLTAEHMTATFMGRTHLWTNPLVDEPLKMSESLQNLDIKKGKLVAC